MANGICPFLSNDHEASFKNSCVPHCSLYTNYGCAFRVLADKAIIDLEKTIPAESNK